MARTLMYVTPCPLPTQIPEHTYNTCKVILRAAAVYVKYWTEPSHFSPSLGVTLVKTQLFETL